jgi:Fe-S cluster biogenesis protein NfuA
MQDVAQEWREMARQAGSDLQDWTGDVLDYLYDDEDEDDEDDVWAMEATMDAMATVTSKEPIVSPFEDANVAPHHDIPAADEPLAFTSENVDKVLEEVRPYLISDGGNVAVARVDEEQKDVYLELQGACGSCASSTVTMKMGIERVLRENFPDLNQVIQIEDEESKPTELTMEAVEEELDRLRPAINAMGGVVQLVSVDPSTGSVEIKFRGAKRVQQGVELALLDVPFVNRVAFTMGDD